MGDKYNNDNQKKPILCDCVVHLSLLLLELHRIVHTGLQQLSVQELHDIRAKKQAGPRTPKEMICFINSP